MIRLRPLSIGGEVCFWVMGELFANDPEELVCGCTNEAVDHRTKRSSISPSPCVASATFSGVALPLFAIEDGSIIFLN
jgi:hypothetical protein